MLHSASRLPRRWASPRSPWLIENTGTTQGQILLPPATTQSVPRNPNRRTGRTNMEEQVGARGSQATCARSEQTSTHRRNSTRRLAQTRSQGIQLGNTGRGQKWVHFRKRKRSRKERRCTVHLRLLRPCFRDRKRNQNRDPFFQEPLVRFSQAPPRIQNHVAL